RDPDPRPAVERAPDHGAADEPDCTQGPPPRETRGLSPQPSPAREAHPKEVAQAAPAGVPPRSFLRGPHPGVAAARRACAAYWPRRSATFLGARRVAPG